MKLSKPQIAMLKSLVPGYNLNCTRNVRSVWQVGRISTAKSLERLGLVRLSTCWDNGEYDKHSTIVLTAKGHDTLVQS